MVPSPRKINMEKISRSPIKNKELTPSNIKTPPRRILHARIQGIVFSECPLIFTIIGFYLELDNFWIKLAFFKNQGPSINFVKMQVPRSTGKIFASIMSFTVNFEREFWCLQIYQKSNEMFVMPLPLKRDWIKKIKALYYVKYSLVSMICIMPLFFRFDLFLVPSLFNFGRKFEFRS